MIQTKKLSQQFYRLRDEADCFASLVLGEKKALLFDTGCDTDDLKQVVEEITSLPLLVIASHGHFDHIGGSGQFDTVYLSEKDWNLLESYDEDQIRRWVKEMTPDREPVFCRKGWNTMKKLDFTHLDLGNLYGEIVELPGHSAGSIGVYFPEWKVLLSGDALTPVMCLIFQNHGTKEIQLRTLRDVEQMDVEYYMTSHSEKKMPKSLISRMIGCIEHSAGKRHYAYAYPKPPYSKGWFYLDSMEEEPVGIIVEKKPEGRVV